MMLVSNRLPGQGASPNSGESRTQHNDWEQTTLDSLCGHRGKSIEPNKQPNQIFELYSVPSFPSGRPEMVLGKQIGSNKQRVTHRSVLLCKINPRINRAWVVGDFSDHPKIASTEWIIFPESEAIEPSFLCYFLQQNTVRDFLAANASGVGGSLMRVKASTLRDFPFSYPERDEQQRVVAEIEKQFTRLDAGVASLKRVHSALKRYRASMLKAACEGRLVPTEAELARQENRSYETGEALLQRILKGRREKWTGKGRYKEPATPSIEELPALSKGWTWASAEQITSMITDGEHITPQRSDSGILLLSARNILDGRLALADVDYVPQSEYDRIAKRLIIKPGDVLLSCSGSVGRSTVVPDALVFTLVRSVAVLKPLQQMGKYLSLALRSPVLQQQISRKKTQTAQANIFQGKIKTLCVPLSPIAEQRSIVAEAERRLSVIEELKTVISTELQRAIRIRQSILEQAFSGRLATTVGPRNL